MNEYISLWLQDIKQKSNEIMQDVNKICGFCLGFDITGGLLTQSETNENQELQKNKMEVINLMTVGEKIKTAREKKGLTQRQVAEIIGVSQPAYCDWENGDGVPSWARMKKIARVLEVSLDELAREDN